MDDLFLQDELVLGALNMRDADVRYNPRFLSPKVSDDLFDYLQKTTPWQQDKITVFGKTYNQPRLTAFYSDKKTAYVYSTITMQPMPFTPMLLKLKKLVDDAAGITFNSCLLNFYRHGQDSNGWHADDESSLGENPVIASVSLGESRWFHMKHKNDATLKQKILLKHGSLLLMSGSTQHHWLHQVPKTRRVIGPRINLTFRVLV